MPDRISVRCSSCHTPYAMPGHLLGRRATCRKCGAKFLAQIEPAPEIRAGGAPPQRPQFTGSKAQAPTLIESPDVDIADALSQADAPRNGTGGQSNSSSLNLDDTVMGWLNDLMASDEEDAPPRVITTDQMCGPNDRTSRSQRGR